MTTTRRDHVSVTLSESQIKMVDRLVAHYAERWAAVVTDEPIAPPTDAEILQLCLHTVHAHVFGDAEHQRVMSGDE